MNGQIALTLAVCLLSSCHKSSPSTSEVSVESPDAGWYGKRISQSDRARLRSHLSDGIWLCNREDENLRMYSETCYSTNGTAESVSKFWLKQPDGTETFWKEIRTKSRWKIEADYLISNDVQSEPSGYEAEGPKKILKLTKYVFVFLDSRTNLVTNVKKTSNNTLQPTGASARG